MKKFWNWIQNEGGIRTLHLEGVISDETWWGDEVTPKMFRKELHSGSGDVEVWINSPGGDVFAAAQIYNMLCEYDGRVTVKIDGIAASAATVVAMAGDEICVSPVSMMMIHNPSTIAWGDSEEMQRAKEMLDEVKETIINAYEKKTKLPHDEISALMDAETWMSAHKAVELGFADKILYAEEQTEPQNTVAGFTFSRMAVTNSLLDKFAAQKPKNKDVPVGEPAQPHTGKDNMNTKEIAAAVDAAVEKALAKLSESKPEQQHTDKDSMNPKEIAAAVDTSVEKASAMGTPVDALEKRLELIKTISKF